MLPKGFRALAILLGILTILSFRYAVCSREDGASEDASNRRRLAPARKNLPPSRKRNAHALSDIDILKTPPPPAKSNRAPGDWKGGPCMTFSYRGKKAEKEAVYVEGLEKSERFTSVLKCAGKYFMFSRAEVRFNDLWSTVVRQAVSASSLENYGDEIIEFVDSAKPKALGPFAHNLAADCVDDKLIAAYGGQDRFGSSAAISSFTKGVARVSAKLPPSVLKPSEMLWVSGTNPTTGQGVVFDGNKNKTQCTEKRDNFKHCEFGKYSTHMTSAGPQNVRSIS